MSKIRNQGNCRFWNPNPLGLGGKTARLERTKAFIFSLTLGPKVWYNESIRLETDSV